MDTVEIPDSIFKTPKNQSVDNQCSDYSKSGSSIFKSPRLQSPVTPVTPGSSESKLKELNGLKRSDFTSDQAWETYRSIIFKKKAQLKNERRKGKRKEESGKKFKAIIEQLKEKQFSGEAAFLEVNKCQI